MPAIDHIAQRGYPTCCMRAEPELPHGLAIYGRYLLTFSQICDGARAGCGANEVSHAAAGAAVVEPKHEAWPLGRAAMHERVHAQRTMCPGEARLDPLDKTKARPPHERAIGKHPEISLAIEAVARHHLREHGNRRTRFFQHDRWRQTCRPKRRNPKLQVVPRTR